MKNTFSSNIEESLNGRTSTVPDIPVPDNKAPADGPKNAAPVSGTEASTKNGKAQKPKAVKPKNKETDKAPATPVTDIIPAESDTAILKPDKGLGKNMDGSFRQSNAGRRAVDPSKKKTQLVLTLMPSTRQTLENWAENKPRSAANYLSDYIESHMQEIMDHYDKI